MSLKSIKGKLILPGFWTSFQQTVFWPDFKKIFLFVSLMMAIVHSISAQSNLSFSMGGGVMYYNGDLSDKSYLPPTEIVKPFGTADISFLLVDRLELSFRYLKGSVKGDDALSDEKDNLYRNLSFHSKIDEVCGVFRVRLFGVRSQRAVNPYGMFGFGYFWFNPQAELNGKTYDLQPLGTEGQFIPGGEYAAPYKLQSASMTLGIGLLLRLNDQFSLRVEASPQLTYTDYLDDASTIYPDSTALAATPNGAIAVQMSSKRPRGYPVKGRSRGNPDRDDVMVTFGMSIVYTPPSRKKTYGAKPGIFNQMFKGRKGWWGLTPN
ncbi:MAG TPA: DUF6089 family protein [Bacteroidia bacterium]|nr:DUF6089 family protein [Bacteroidia bacterium]